MGSVPFWVQFRAYPKNDFTLLYCINFKKVSFKKIICILEDSKNFTSPSSSKDNYIYIFYKLDANLIQNLVLF